MPRPCTLLLPLLALSLPSCGIARMVFLTANIQEQARPVPFGARTDTSIEPGLLLSTPGATSTLTSPRNPPETIEWYRRILSTRGWQWDAPDATSSPDPITSLRTIPIPELPAPDATGEWRFHAHRTSALKIGPFPLADESLHLTVRRQSPAPGCDVTISISGDYLWDLPSKSLIYLAIMPPALFMGEGVIYLQPIYIWF